MLKERNVDVAMFQETKKSQISDVEVRTMWAGEKMEFMGVGAKGSAGRQIVMHLGFRYFLDFQNVAVIEGLSLSQGELWERLVNLKEKFPKPWCLAGDFNEIRSMGERKGCSRRDRGTQELNEFIDKYEVSDLPLLGRKLTWCNSGDKEMWSRIDKVLVDPKWWKEANVVGWAGYVLLNKLKTLKLGLKKWNVEIFGNVTNKLKTAESDLHKFDLLAKDRDLTDSEKATRR
ncbi:uncharacterized protein LOC114298467 [Camellia sinensis]|uniref:uncharacterized protein LOC114298467 n=1 Tax=Camellia sinensis TaxID=4442 RepID=UPI001035A164|nr:uncharacterized protein LOC114298467 [Camellia sinensis]